MSEAIIFPGQGAQFAGMGQDWVQARPAAKRTFERADEVLGFKLSEAIWAAGEGVNRTDLAQPGILTTSIAILNCLIEDGLDLSAAPVAAGLSLGEYTALWCAGALSFEDALLLVRLRGEAMQAASEACESGMTSLMGASPEVAQALAELGSSAGICSVANLNAPGQVVVSGELAALDLLEAAAKERGVKRAIRLNVAGGFHSECMRPAAERLEAALVGIEIQSPRIKFVSNVTAAPLSEPSEIKTALARQVCSPVLWERSMLWCLEQGFTRFLEPGPGNVLSGLLRRITKESGHAADVRGIERPEQVTS